MTMYDYIWLCMAIYDYVWLNWWHANNQRQSPKGRQPKKEEEYQKHGDNARNTDDPKNEDQPKNKDTPKNRIQLIVKTYLYSHSTCNFSLWLPQQEWPQTGNDVATGNRNPHVKKYGSRQGTKIKDD